MAAVRTDTQQLVLDVLGQAEVALSYPGRKWMALYVGYGDSFVTRLDRLHRERFPDRRSRLQHRHVQGAFRTLLAEGLIEHREGEHDDYYRLAS